MLGPAQLAEPFAIAPQGWQLTLDTTQHTDPGTLIRTLRLPVSTGQFTAELDQSVRYLALARERQPGPGPDRIPLRALAGRPGGLALLEQSVVDGHPLHPCCRTRLGMSAEEVLAYAPEHRPTVHLAVHDVPAKHWLTTGAGLPPRLPVHPWQREHVLPAYASLLGLRPSGELIAARPLMSLRTLASVADPRRHYKTAIAVQMTSAVRIVSAAAVRNGPVLSALLTRAGAGLPIDIWPETAAAAVLDGAGEPLPGLSITVRRAGLPGPDEVTMPIAALAADGAGGRPLLTEAVQLGYGGHPSGFLADLAAVLIPPLVALLHRGIALEAHGQNLLITLQHGRPARVSYRDMGGIRVSPHRLRRAGIAAPPLYGDISCDDPAQLRAKAFASGVTLALGEPIAILAREYGVDPKQLWRLVGDRVALAYGLLPLDAGGDERALLTEPLPVKATTAMRLAVDPGGTGAHLADIWAELDSPFDA